jgi:hypothetical protein
VTSEPAIRVPHPPPPLTVSFLFPHKEAKSCLQAVDWKLFLAYLQRSGVGLEQGRPSLYWPQHNEYVCSSFMQTWTCLQAKSLCQCLAISMENSICSVYLSNSNWSGISHVHHNFYRQHPTLALLALLTTCTSGPQHSHGILLEPKWVCFSTSGCAGMQMVFRTNFPVSKFFGGTSLSEVVERR